MRTVFKIGACVKKMVSTVGRSGPICRQAVAPKVKGGLQKISESDRLLRNFSVSNPNIASVGERWYGREVSQRPLLGNASDRIRGIVDMFRNNDGGLLRAIFSKNGQLKRVLSVAKDGSLVATTFQKGSINGVGLANFTKKVVRSADGTKLREIYTVADNYNPKRFLSFIVDAKKGLSQTLSSNNGLLRYRQGDIVETFNKGFGLQKGEAAGVDTLLQNSLNTIKNQGWVKFLKQSFSK